MKSTSKSVLILLSQLIHQTEGGTKMNLPLLKVEMRERSRKNGLKGVRREGFIPGTVYGHNKESKSVRFEKKELEKLLKKYGTGSSVALQTDEGVKHAIVKDVQRHITKHHVLHIDFQELSDNEKVRVRIPLYLLNRSEVESSTNILQQQVTELEIMTYPKYLPQTIETDVAAMDLSAPIKVKDLDIYSNDNIEVLNDPEEIVVLLTSAMKEDVVVEEVEEDLLRKLY